MHTVLSTLNGISPLPMDERSSFFLSTINDTPKPPVTLEDAAENMNWLIGIISCLDNDSQLHPWILDHPFTSGEDIEDELPTCLVSTKLNGHSACKYNIIAHATYALGHTFIQVGNLKHGHHLMLCASSIYRAVFRAGPRTKSDIQFDHSVSFVIYKQLANQALQLNEPMQALEFATKLVALHDIVVAECVSNATDESIDSMTSEVRIDINENYAAQLLLAKAATASKNHKTAFSAYKRALQLLEFKGSIRRSESSLIQNDAAFSRAIKRDLYLKIVVSNELSEGDARASYEYMIKALNLTSDHVKMEKEGSEVNVIEINSDSGVDIDHEISTLVGPISPVLLKLKAAGIIYQYALSLSGGVEHAASPPIAVFPDDASNPPIRKLLSESIDYLKDALVLIDTSDQSTSSNLHISICLQLIILYIDMRMDEEAKALIEETHIPYEILLELNKDSDQENSNNCLRMVVYSPEVFKKLQTLYPHQNTQVTSPNSQAQDKAEKYHRRVSELPCSTKLTCGYCCMTFVSSNPLQCEDCSSKNGSVALYFCMDECRFEHSQMHFDSKKDFSVATSMIGVFRKLMM